MAIMLQITRTLRALVPPFVVALLLFSPIGLPQHQIVHAESVALPPHPLPIMGDGLQPQVAETARSYQLGHFNEVLSVHSTQRAAVAGAQLLALKALAAQAVGQSSEALQYARQATSLRPGSSDTLYVLGFVEAAHGNVTAATGALKDAIWFNRFTLFRAPGAWSLLAAAYAAQNLQEEAQKALANAGDEADESAQRALAAVQIRNQNVGSAIPLLRQMNRKHPESRSHKLELARALSVAATSTLHTGEMTEAEALAREIISDPQASDSERLAGYEIAIQSAAKLRRTSEADSLYREAQRLFPKAESLRSLRHQLTIDTLAVRQQQPANDSPVPSSTAQ